MLLRRHKNVRELTNIGDLNHFLGILSRANCHLPHNVLDLGRQTY